VTEARAAELSAKEIPEKARAASQLAEALTSLFAAADRRQNLGRDASYRHIKKLVLELNDLIASEGARFNQQATALNLRLQRMPGSLVGSFAGLKPQARFDPSEADRQAETAPSSKISTPAT
jgi:hypothetical protein